MHCLTLLTMGAIALLLAGSAAPAASAQLRQAPPAAKPGAAPSRTAGSASTMRFRRQKEPREGAFTILVPEGWQVAGGIRRVDPTAAGGSANSIEAKLDFTVQRGAEGSAMIRWLPDVNFIDMRGMPAGQMGMFPPGSNYNGMTVMPVMDAASFLERVAFRYAHPRVANPRVTARKPAPELVRAIQSYVRFLPIASQFRFDGAILTLQYEENGTAYREKLIGGIQNMGAIGAGMWTNKMTMLARAPEAEFNRLVRVFTVIQDSIQINGQWLAGEINGQLVRAGIAARTQREIQEIERQIVEHRQRMNSEINNDMYLTLTGQEERINPHTGRVERTPDEFRYRWVTPSGEEVWTNDDYYDPNTDPRENRTGFKRSPVRPRMQ